jgi:protein SCO1/2
MTARVLRLAGVALATLLATVCIGGGALAESTPGADGSVDIVEHLGERVPADLPFVDSSGRAMHLRDTLAGRPIVLALVYYRCVGLCSVMLSGLTTALRGTGWRLGREVDVVTVSIDPDETPALADPVRTRNLQVLGETGPGARWSALTGPSSSIDALAAAVGFRFSYLEGQRQFAHAAALFVLTPDGRVSRYLYGVEFPSDQLKAAVFEASGGKVGTSFERVILRCFPWDPASRHYRLFLVRYYRIAGLVILVAVGAFLAALWRRDLARGTS